MVTEYDRLLSLTLELEGLILLKINRSESAPARLSELISEKIALISSLDGDGSAEESCAATAALDDADTAAAALEEEAADAEPETTDAEEEEIIAAGNTLAADRAEAEATVTTLNDRATATDIAAVFTLNDKFRFRRELFRNSNEELVDTLNVLRAMSSLDEAEDYLYNDLAWDPDNEDVRAFVELIAPCYRN